jgi:hypothetical protein
VGNGGATSRDPRGGAGIDRHEAVFRFNFAQTAGYEGFVGSKTTVRVINHLRSRAIYHWVRWVSPSSRGLWGGDALLGTETLEHSIELNSSFS